MVAHEKRPVNDTYSTLETRSHSCEQALAAMTRVAQQMDDLALGALTKHEGSVTHGQPPRQPPLIKNFFT
jgi:hypothetical protein